MAPWERSLHDSNVVGSPGRLGAGLQQSTMDRKCRTDTATRKLTIGWDIKRFTEPGYKARHCKYMTLVFINHRYFYWSRVTFQCCVSFYCTAKWIGHTHAHTRQEYMHFNPMEYYSAINHLLLWLSFSVKRSFPFLLPRLMCQQYTAITIAETRCRREGGERDQTKTIKTKAKAKEKSLSTWCDVCAQMATLFTPLRTLDFGGP